jgi:hypothetical protein
LIEGDLPLGRVLTESHYAVRLPDGSVCQHGRSAVERGPALAGHPPRAQRQPAARPRQHQRRAARVAENRVDPLDVATLREAAVKVALPNSESAGVAEFVADSESEKRA